jgi:general nucleoside transport system permease protein
VRWQRTSSISAWKLLVSRILAVLVALCVGGAALAAVGHNVRQLLWQVLDSSFGTEFGLQDLGLLVSPLILTGLAAAIPLRMGLWNIGAEGQFYAGAICATAIGLFLHGPSMLMLFIMAISGIVGGAAWIAIPALSRAFLQVNEIITTLLMNFVAILLVNALCTGPWRDKAQAITSATAAIPYEVPELAGDLHWGLGIAVIVAVIAALILTFTKWGFEVRLAGANQEAAFYAGVPVKLRLLQVLLISGGIAGLAGMLEVAGTVHHLQGGISNNFGYLGVGVAVIAGAAPLAVVAAGAFMALMLNAGIVLQSHGVSTYEVLSLTGLVLALVAAGEQLAHYQLTTLVMRKPRV